MYRIQVGILWMFVLFCCGKVCAQELKHNPYEHSVGTVHQFGFVGGVSIMRNPNIQNVESKSNYTDYSMGAVYSYRNYITQQLSVESTISVTMQTAKALTETGSDKLNQKMIFPVDVRASVGPNEDITMFLGVGFQWSVVTRNILEEGSSSVGKSQSQTVHQLSENSTVGFSFFGPSKYRIHFCTGVKLHCPILNSRTRSFYSNLGEVDVSCDKSSMSWMGSITCDLDKKKRLVMILNYELPLEREQSNSMYDSGFFSRTQMASIGLMFYLGGSR